MDVKPASIVILVVGLALAAAIGLMLGPGASWWLEHVDGVTGLQGEKLAAAVDAVRGRALAVATGLAALLAVYYTARNADTARRTFQLGERGHDTDRYGKAAEQLGHDKAPVRLAGLYALEELAQNNPALRQRIVDVICAYLRMPFSPPQDDDQENAHPAVPRAAIGGRSDNTDKLEERDRREERQVRLAAQRVLAAHLRYELAHKHWHLLGRRWSRRAKRPSGSFWPSIRIDLTEATLFDFDFDESRMRSADFAGATFTGKAQFRGATFSGEADFSGATFDQVAKFHRSTFRRRASFDDVTFKGGAVFDRATLSWFAGFDRITVAGDIAFSGTIFEYMASLRGVSVTGNVSFHRATFAKEAAFDDSTFACNFRFQGVNSNGYAGFRGTVFAGDANFAGTTLAHAEFGRATFERQADFSGVSFIGAALFEDATFTVGASFVRASFGKKARFAAQQLAQPIDLEGALLLPGAMGQEHQWPPRWRVRPDGKGGGVLHREPMEGEQGPAPQMPA
ncbi:pentapeptide repeat-containing protein [Nonomuraea sp. NPDC026600]|uniref:pentapeptide repeat-containing protein n=1 Tax=Nonomuraea sp. NPDC026600 TaxID=3155363 RepID=UPI0033D3155C